MPLHEMIQERVRHASGSVFHNSAIPVAHFCRMELIRACE